MVWMMHPPELRSSSDNAGSASSRDDPLRTSDLFLVIDSSGEIQMANVDSGCFLPELLGDTLIGRSLFELIDPEDHGALRNIITECLERGKDFNLKVLTKRDCTEVNLWLNPLQGRKRGLCAAVLSLPGRETADIDGFMGFMKGGLDDIKQPIIIVDQIGKILFVNQAVEGRLKVSRNEMVGHGFSDIIDASRLSGEQLESVLRSVPAGGNCEIVLPLVSSAGEVVDTTSRLVCLLYGEEEKIIVIFGDADVSVEEESSSGLPFLIKISLEMSDTPEPLSAAQETLDRLVEVEGMQFAIFRMVDSDNEPFMLCSNIGFKEARDILTSGMFDHDVPDGGLGDHVIIDWTDPLPGIPGCERITLLAIPIGQPDRLHGIAVFGLDGNGARVEAKVPMLRLFCNQVVVSVRTGRLARVLTKRNSELRSLYEALMALTSTLDVERILETVLHRVADLVGADNVFLFRLIDRGRLVCSNSICEYPEKVRGAELKIGEGITGLVAARGEGMLVERADQDARSFHVAGTPNGFSSLISVPIRVGEEMFGVITLERESGMPFCRREYQLIEMLSVTAAVSIKNAVLYERLERYASEYRLFNSLLTHDVANYNVPIHGFLEMLVTDPKLDERQRSYVRKALIQSDSISSLIANVRKLAELSAAENVNPRLVDIVPLISRSIGEIYLNTLNADLSVFFNPRIDSAFVMADDLLEGLFFNLLSNASKFGGGQVSIEISPHEENGRHYWKVDFIDRGKGIPDERKKRIFDRVWELDSDRRSEGHGLGLSVVKALCERYGGRVWIEDRIKGDHTQGSVFSVILPRAKNV